MIWVGLCEEGSSLFFVSASYHWFLFSSSIFLTSYNGHINWQGAHSWKEQFLTWSIGLTWPWTGGAGTLPLPLPIMRTLAQYLLWDLTLLGLPPSMLPDCNIHFLALRALVFQICNNLAMFSEQALPAWSQSLWPLFVRWNSIWNMAMHFSCPGSNYWPCSPNRGLTLTVPARAGPICQPYFLFPFHSLLYSHHQKTLFISFILLIFLIDN